MPPKKQAKKTTSKGKAPKGKAPTRRIPKKKGKPMSTRSQKKAEVLPEQEEETELVYSSDNDVPTVVESDESDSSDSSSESSDDPPPRKKRKKGSSETIMERLMKRQNKIIMESMAGAKAIHTPTFTSKRNEREHKKLAALKLVATKEGVYLHSCTNKKLFIPFIHFNCWVSGWHVAVW
jgi:hypothetical protein